MNKKDLDILKENRMYDQCIYVPSLKEGKYIVFGEGTGDNLLQEDIKEGYVDYINYTIYDLSLNGDIKVAEYYSGMILLKKFYRNMPMEEILEYVLEDASYPDKCPDIDTEDIRVIDLSVA